jgi:hypothetical protein
MHCHHIDNLFMILNHVDCTIDKMCVLQTQTGKNDYPQYVESLILGIANICDLLQVSTNQRHCATSR